MPTTFPNIDFKFRRGTKEGLQNTPILNGSFNICKDTRQMFIDIDNQRYEMSDMVTGMNEVSIISLDSPEPKVYLSSDTFKLMWFDASSLSWKTVGADSVAAAVNAEFSEKDKNGNEIDSYYISKTESDEKDIAIQQQVDNLLLTVGDIERFDVALYDSIADLPETGTKGIIYFVLEDGDSTAETTESENTGKIYMEYIWVSNTYNNDDTDPDMPTGFYEKIGITTVDLGEYYTKAEIDKLITGLETGVEGQISDLDYGDEG